LIQEWYKNAFDAAYGLLYAHRTVEQAESEARFAVEQLGLEPGAAVLDLCCGNGRHLVYLVERAGRAVGLDYSSHMLEQARVLVGKRALLVRADMRAMPFEGVFDAVTSFFTSFGYFAVAAEILEVARGIARALKPSGTFFIDYFNRAYVEHDLVPHSVVHRQGYEIRETRWIDQAAKRLNKTSEIWLDGRRLDTTTESVQLYSPEDFACLLAEAGLAVERFLGDYAGAPLDDSLPRMIAVGRKT